MSKRPADAYYAAGETDLGCDGVCDDVEVGGSEERGRLKRYFHNSLVEMKLPFLSFGANRIEHWRSSKSDTRVCACFF